MDNQNDYRQYYNQMPPKAPKKPGTMKKILIGALVGIVFGAFAGAGFMAVTAAGNFIKDVKTDIAEAIPSPEGKTEAKEEQPAAEKTEPDTAIADTPVLEEPAISRFTDITDVVEATMPSLVSVNNKFTQKFNYFGQTYYQDTEGAGSGIIIGENTEELLLITNYHVVKDANELTVTFDDNSEATAYFKGGDENRDIAVLSVPLEAISSSTKGAIAVATLGDSDKLEVGETVIAIGNSLGYGQSVTAGVVSALNRPIGLALEEGAGADQEIPTFIQTDAPINPGNSGGALLNTKGEVVGINSNKLGGSVVEGMSYAIPISDARPIIEEIMTKKTRIQVSEENKGYLGITGVDVSPENSEIYGMPIGVFISSVSEGTGASDAGLVRGDIIVGINGEEVRSMDDLKTELSYYSAGTEVELTIMQGTPTGYQSRTVKVLLSEASR